MHVNNFIVLLLFFNLTLQKCAINISQNFLRTAEVLSWIALLYFFLTSWIWNKFVFEKILLYKQLFKSDNPLVLGPVIVQSFDFNYALYKAETSLRACLHGLGDLGLVGFLFFLFSRSGGHKTKETYPTRSGSPTPCKQGLRRTADTFKTVNGPLRSALGNEKYRKTEM